MPLLIKCIQNKTQKYTSAYQEYKHFLYAIIKYAVRDVIIWSVS